MKLSAVLVLLFSAAFVIAQTQPSAPATASSPAHLAPEAAAALAEKKVPAIYPEKARARGIQGTVVLNVVISETGDVKEATVASGDADLAQSASDSIKQWKYKPYTVDGKPTPVESQVTFGFHIKAPPPSPTPGRFKDGQYQNEFFGISYPLSTEWVRETTLIRAQLASEQGPQQTSQVLLAALHVPSRSEGLVADSSFVLIAPAVSLSAQEDAKDYLAALAVRMSAEKRAKLDGEITRLLFADLAAYRADFKPFKGETRYQAILCAVAKGYLLEWNFRAATESALEDAVASVKDIAKFEPAPAHTSKQDELQIESDEPARLTVERAVTAGRLIAKVAPRYPQSAKSEHIQGLVVLHAAIDKAGNVIDLEAVAGPSELVPSSVNAVRQWKYKPYLLNGKPIELDTTIEVRYTLARY